MGRARSVARVAVLESQQTVREDPSPPHDAGPYYAAALLKLAVELRRPEPQALDQTIGRVLEGLPVDRDAFRAYVQRNFSLLRR